MLCRISNDIINLKNVFPLNNIQCRTNHAPSDTEHIGYWKSVGFTYGTKRRQPKGLTIHSNDKITNYITRQSMSVKFDYDNRLCALLLQSILRWSHR